MKITFKEFQEEYEWNILKQDDCVKTFDCGVRFKQLHHQ